MGDIRVLHGFDLRGPASGRPDSPDGGIYYYNETTGRLEVYDEPQAQWVGGLSVARAVYDFAVDGGAIGDITPSDGFKLPDNAVILGGFVDVLTTFTSATDAATVAVKTESAGDIVAAVAINDVSNPWDAGRHSVIPDFSGAKAVKLTAARDIVLTVATEALTAGKAEIALAYFVTQ